MKNKTVICISSFFVWLGITLLLNANLDAKHYLQTAGCYNLKDDMLAGYLLAGPLIIIPTVFSLAPAILKTIKKTVRNN